MQHGRSQRGRMAAGALAVAVVLAACSGDDDGDAAPVTTLAASASTPSTEPAPTAAPTTAPATTGPATTEPATTQPAATPAPAELVAAIEADLAAVPPGCDPIDPRHCFLPFPSNAYVVDDAASDTGRRVAFPGAAAPVNADGVAMDLTEWNRNDGFSPNTTILTYVDGLDPAASDLPPWTDLERSLEPDATVVLVDVDTGERVPLWAEVDVQPEAATDRLLVVHPAVTLAEGHTYAIGFRGLVRTDGTPVEPSAAFTAWRDALTTDIAAIEDRRPAMEAALAALEAAGADRSDLQVAWDFTIASTRNLTERMLHLRDESLDAAGPFTITGVVDAPTDDEGRPIEGVGRQVTGTFTVTNWLTGDGAPGNGFNTPGAATDPDALPVANGTREAPFACNVPTSVLAGTAPGHVVQYGHGLLGSHLEINAGNLRRFTNDHGAVVCATKWAGMSEDDIGNAVASLEDMSNFPTLTDRLQQGVLDQLVLSRLLLAPDGLGADPAFQRADGSPLLDVAAGLDYDGNSQGGIMGLMLAGVSTDIERFVLGVPGMNYGLLLPRSVDFDQYELIFEPAYPGDLDRALIVAMIQMLWDRGEGAGYVNHVTADPLPGTPAKTVLLHVALGDHQVSELAAMIAARTMGVPIHRPVTADGRSREVEPGWALETLAYPSTGSGLVVWDSGAPLIPIENVPPTAGEDPHEDPRADPDVQAQKAAFLFEETLRDVCAAAACPADPT